MVREIILYFITYIKEAILMELILTILYDYYVIIMLIANLFLFSDIYGRIL